MASGFGSGVRHVSGDAETFRPLRQPKPAGCLAGRLSAVSTRSGVRSRPPAATHTGHATPAAAGSAPAGGATGDRAAAPAGPATAGRATGNLTTAATGPATTRRATGNLTTATTGPATTGRATGNFATTGRARLTRVFRSWPTRYRFECRLGRGCGGCRGRGGARPLFFGAIATGCHQRDCAAEHRDRHLAVCLHQNQTPSALVVFLYPGRSGPKPGAAGVSSRRGCVR